METKRCPKCGKTKATEEFFKNGGRPDGRSVYCRVCQQEANAAHQAKQKAKVFEALGGARCKRCEFDDKRALLIDHIDGGGTRHRREAVSSWAVFQHVLAHPEEYQVLCCNCSQIKRHENGEWASHEYKARVGDAPAREVLHRPRRWARDFDACTGCGRTDTPHQSRGKCRTCFAADRRRAKGIPPKKARRVLVQEGQRWSVLHEACQMCGTTSVPHASKGLCKNCYMRGWHRKHRD